MIDSNVNLDQFSSRRSTVYSMNGIVAASQPLAAETGVAILRHGGNAFDAAVATAAALNVVEPTNTGLGGDVFAMYRTPDGEVGGLQSGGCTPAEATIDKVRERVAAEAGVSPATVEMPSRGPHTVTVPGTARGWEVTVQEFGRLSLTEVLQPAIDLAIDGFPVTEIIANDWKLAEDLFTDDHARNAYLTGDCAPSVGERVTLPQLGASLQQIAQEGADVVYEGSIAETIASEVQAKGGFLTVEDLAAFEPTFVDPVSTRYRGATIYELPPNNQGLIALEALNIAEAIDAGSHPLDSPERIHFFVEAMKRAFHDGHYHISDPEFVDIPPLESKAFARQRAETIGERAAADVSVDDQDLKAEDADTVLLTVADDEGNLVTYINSRFEQFGSGLVAGQTGIALQNRGASFSLSSDHPNKFEPGKRPKHTLIPALARLDAEDWAAFGVMGGFLQPQGHLQILANVLDYELPLQAALDYPRWRYRASGLLALEHQTKPELMPKLVRRGHDIRIAPPVDFGGAQIVRNNGGVLSGASDPRKDGLAVGY